MSGLRAGCLCSHCCLCGVHPVLCVHTIVRVGYILTIVHVFLSYSWLNSHGLKKERDDLCVCFTRKYYPTREFQFKMYVNWKGLWNHMMSFNF